MSLMPDAFEGDPLGYAGNQCGHAMIGLGLWIFANAVWPGWGEALALAVGSAYFLLVEWAWQRLRLFWDSVEDAAHVTLGGAIGFSIDQNWAPWAFLGWAIVLAFGMARRT